jgi:hypothetical protein
MISQRVLMTVLTLTCASWVTACERNQEQLTPAAKTEEGRQKAEEYPSTRNTENPDPSIGGTNSASTRPEAHPDTTAGGKAPEQTTTTH